jgi:hypothetical protein
MIPIRNASPAHPITTHFSASRLNIGAALLSPVFLLLLLVCQAVFGQGFPLSKLRSFALDATAGRNLDLSNQLQYQDNVLAYVTADSIHLMNAPLACPVALCAECFLFTTPLLSIRIPGGPFLAPPAFALVAASPKMGFGDPTQVTFAVLPPRGKLHLYTAKVTGNPGDWVLTHDSLALVPKAGQVAKLLDFQALTRFSDPFGANAFPDSFFTVAGTQGLLSYVHWKDGAFGEVTNGTFPGDDITAIGPGTLGGASGWIYQLQSDTGPARSARPFNAAIRYLDETGALGDSGNVAVKEAAGWSGFKVAGSGYRGFLIGYASSGLVIDLWGRSGDRMRQVLRDAPTSLAATWDQGILRLEPDGETNAYIPGALPWTIAVHLADPEGNYLVPGIELNRLNTEGETLTGGRFQRTIPSGGCEAPGICVQASTPDIGLILKPDSLVIEMKVQASFRPMCGSNWAEKRDSLIRIARAWKFGDVVHIGGKGAGYSIQYSPGMAVGGSMREAATRFPAVLERSRGMAAWPEGMHADRSARARIYGADGIRMGDFAPGERLLRFKAGLAFVVWPENKGNFPASRVLLR